MNVVLLWHLHQPDYVDAHTQTALMPWVRLHAVQGYADMLEMMARVPEMRATFNITPILARQLEQYSRGEVTDLWETWSRMPADALSLEVRRSLLENFFKIHWIHRLEPVPRYRELLERRGRRWTEESLDAAAQSFSPSDWRDLQTWFNLAWCGFSARREYPELEELRRQGRDFSEEQKLRVLDLHRQIASGILPGYRAAAQRGQIELSTSPFFHPILPLVYDTNLARRCQPQAALPARFSAPDDARAHLVRAQASHLRLFGKPATGLWPSEGSVAPEIIPLAVEAGFKSLCTDEGILWETLARQTGRAVDPSRRDILHQGWQVNAGGTSMRVLFRDHGLSDFIGFEAARMPAEQSAEYLLEALRAAAVGRPESAVVTLALDGENAWESFPDLGERFLQLFYEGLVSASELTPQTMEGQWQQFPPAATLETLHTGSWINSDFDIWIGDPEENKAWEWLGRARAFLKTAEASAEAVAAAWDSLYAAEGSDWFWWYGPDFSTDSDLLFDQLFRGHLQHVYRVLGVEPPDYLQMPICLPTMTGAGLGPRGWISPSIADAGSFFDWAGAAEVELAGGRGGAMHRGRSIGQRLRYGFSPTTFYLRLNWAVPPDEVTIYWISPRTCRARLTPTVATAAGLSRAGAVALGMGAGVWGQCHSTFETTPDGIHFEPLGASADLNASWSGFALSVAASTEVLGWKQGKEAAFFVQALVKGQVVERYPAEGAIAFLCPEPDFGKKQWIV